MEKFDAIIVGGGQAGLATSYFLKKQNVKHLVLEKSSIGNSWRTQRWDSFVVNTPNYLNLLPDSDPVGTYRDGFCTRNELVSSFEKYARKFDLPVISDKKVISVKSFEDSKFLIETTGDNKNEFTSCCVIIASGMMQKPKIPNFSKNLSSLIKQFHAGNYRNPSEISRGSVVVVGSGQSGCQIVEDLLNAGKKVFLCTSKVGRIPRRYRGKEIDDWFIDSGFFDVTLDELEDKNISKTTQPQVSGVGRYGHTVSLQKLHKEGVILLGKLENIENDKLFLKDNLDENIIFADEFSNAIKKNIDKYIVNNGITTETTEDPADVPWKENIPTPETTLDLKKSNVKTIIWCTGFTADFSWIKLPVLNPSGFPVHSRGVSSIPGLYFIGFPWLYKRKSGLICGVSEDAEYISKKVLARLDQISLNSTKITQN